MSDPLSLHKLLESSMSGDSKSQHSLYRKLYPGLFRAACRYGFRDHEIAEVINDSFLKLLTGKQKPEKIENVEAWAVRIAAFTAIDKYRKLTANFRKIEKADLQKAELEISRESDHADANDEYKFLLYLLDQLPVIERLVFNLFVMEGYSHDEIAKQLSTSNNMSRKYLKQARQKLKELYESSKVGTDG